MYTCVCVSFMNQVDPSMKKKVVSMQNSLALSSKGKFSSIHICYAATNLLNVQEKEKKKKIDREKQNLYCLEDSPRLRTRKRNQGKGILENE